VSFRWAAEASGLVRVAMFTAIGGGSQGEMKIGGQAQKKPKTHGGDQCNVRFISHM
jgi:hypothetical protein